MEVIFKRERSDGNVTLLSVNEFKGHKFIDLRNFYREGSELKPGKQGITFNSPELAEDISEALKTAAIGLREALETDCGTKHSKGHL